MGKQCEPILAVYTRWCVYVLLLIPLVQSSLFYFHYSAPKVFFFLGVSEILFVLFGWLWHTHPEYAPKIGVIGKLLALFVGVLILTSLVGVDPLKSFWGSASRSSSLLVWGHLFGVFVVFSSMFRSRQAWQRVFLVCVCVALLVSGIVWASYFGWDVLVRAKSGSTIGNSSFLGTYLLFQIVFAGFLLRSKNTYQQWLGGVGVCFLSLTLLLTPSHAAHYVFFGGGVLFVALLLWRSKKRPALRVVGKGILLLLTVCFVSGVLFSFVPGSSVREFMVAKSSNTRFILWEIAWKGIKERPLLGWGLENYEAVFTKFYNPCLGAVVCGREVWFDRAHMIFLDVLIEAGVLGLVVYIALLFWFAWKVASSFRTSPTQPVEQGLLLVLLAMYVIQNLTVFDSLVSLMFFVMVCAYVSQLSEQQGEGKLARPLPYIFPLLFSILLPGMFFFFVIKPVQANIATRDVLVATTMNTRYQLYEDALTTSSWGIDSRRSFLAGQTVALIWGIDSQVREANRMLFEREMKMIQQGLRETIVRNPSDLDAYLNLGLLDVTQAHFFDPLAYQKAEDDLRGAIAQSPQNPLPYWGLVMIFLDQQLYQEAHQVAIQALELNPSNPQSQWRYLLTLKFLGDPNILDQAIQTMSPTLRGLDVSHEKELFPDFDEHQDEWLLHFYYDKAF